VRTEQVPWGASASRFSWAFEEWVAYLAQITDQTHVHKLTGVAWVTVGQIIERVVQRRLSPDRLVNLRRIGIDEFSYRKRHRYLTIVVDHDRRRVVWAAEGRNAETLRALFRELGPQTCTAVELVSIDMAGGYKKAIAEFLLTAQVIYDRFTSNAWPAMPSMRCDACWFARRRLPLPPFVRVARTLRAHFDGVPAYICYRSSESDAYVEQHIILRILVIGNNIRHRLTNGLAEGLNNKLRIISRRAYGFRSAEALIEMPFLNSGGIELSPRLPPPTPC
jgi:transposase